MELFCEQCRHHFSLSPRAQNLLSKFKDEPMPTLCFSCSQKRRLLFRNGRNLYRRSCDFTGDPIISIYASEKPYVVYKSDVWWSDRWDALSYGREIDFDTPFFEQFHALQLRVPRLALTNIKAENSEYCNMTEGNKDCYLIFGGDLNQGCMYGTFGMHNISVVDCDTSNYCERCYALSDSYHCYDCAFTFDSQNCSACAFVSDCIGCTECILCTNLVKKSHCIRNVQLSKEEYAIQKAALLSGSHAMQRRMWNEFLELRAKRIVKSAHVLSSEGCSGDYIQGSKDCDCCFDTWNAHDLADVILAFDVRDALRSGCVGNGSELCYDMQSTIAAYNCRHSFSVFDSSDIEYCDFAFQCRHLFGCCGMKKAKYCILNMQYSEEEFHRLRARLVEYMKSTGEWGKFFPSDCSCFSYNESTAPSYFPLTKAAAVSEGFQWFESTELPPEAVRTIAASGLPDLIHEIPDDILQWAIVCEKTGRSFKILKQELDFYRSMQLPVPRLHPDERYRERLSLRNPLQLFARACAKCSEAIETTYSPDRPETVYCESCYLETVY